METRVSRRTWSQPPPVEREPMWDGNIVFDQINGGDADG